jgi:uncharacterized protein YbaP (TraB family)
MRKPLHKSFLFKSALPLLSWTFILLWAHLAWTHLAYAAPALWQVKAEGKPGAVYLYGTIHVLPKGVAWKTENVEKVMAQADRLVLELDFTDPEFLNKAQQAVIKNGLITDGRTLDQLISPPVYEKVTELAKQAGLPPQALRQMRPWLASLTLTQVAFQKEGFDAENGVEKTLLSLATKPNRKVIGLETIEQQMGFFAKLSDAGAQALLTDTLDQLQNAPAEIQSLKKAWLSGDPEALLKQINERIRVVPELEKALLTERNKAWLPSIISYLDEPGVSVVAVGAGHLHGPEGVIPLLQARGYSVTRVGE